MLRSDLLAGITGQMSARVESSLANDHPPPFSPNSDVTFSDFSFDVTLQAFAFGPGAIGWQYIEQQVSFSYQAHPGIISESGTIYIFTTNQNHKSLTVDAAVNFAGSTPTIDVESSSFFVESGDLFVVGTCSDTICLIPVSSIIDPIAAQYIPGLQKAIQNGVQSEGSAFLSRLSTLIKVQLSATSFLIFDEEGNLDVLADGSLAYTASGATLIQQGGKISSPPQSNSVSLPPASLWGESSEASVALSPYFFSSFIWALGASGDLDVVISQAPPSSPIQLTTDNYFFKTALPGLANYSNMNLTLSLSPLPTWAPSSLNSTGLTIGPLSFLMAINIVNHGSVVVSNAATLNVTMALQLALSADLEPQNKVALHFAFAGHQSSVAVIASKIGAVNTNAFQVLITFAFALAKIPTAILSLPTDFQASNVSVTFQQGLFVLGLDGLASLPPKKFVRSIFREVRAKREENFVPAMKLRQSARLSSNDTQICGSGQSSCADGETCCM